MASDVTDIVGDRLADEQAFAGNEPVTSDERPLGKAYMSHRKALERLAWLFNPKEGSTRARGCRIFLLEESVEALKAEIGYYNRQLEALRGEVAGVDLRRLVIPSAKWIDNPYRPDKPFRRPKSRRKRRT